MPPSNILKRSLLIERGNYFILHEQKVNLVPFTLITLSLLPRGTIEFKINALLELADKSKAVLIYCRTGGRCALAAQTLQKIRLYQCTVVSGWL